MKKVEKPLGKNEMEDILNGKHICHGTLGCPFTNYWIKKGIKLEKAGYEQGKKDLVKCLKEWAYKKGNRKYIEAVDKIDLEDFVIMLDVALEELSK
jgi:hypothetical protein